MPSGFFLTAIEHSIKSKGIGVYKFIRYCLEEVFLSLVQRSKLIDLISLEGT
jgi:hypothetical protein